MASMRPAGTARAAMACSSAGGSGLPCGFITTRCGFSQRSSSCSNTITDPVSPATTKNPAMSRLAQRCSSSHVRRDIAGRRCVKVCASKVKLRRYAQGTRRTNGQCAERIDGFPVKLVGHIVEVDQNSCAAAACFEFVARAEIEQCVRRNVAAIVGKDGALADVDNT